MAPPSQPKDISLFNDPTLSDVKIRQIYKGKTKEYFAHKAILCAHSNWFLKAFTGSFKEASEKTIEVLDDDPKNFEYMLKFFYTMEIDIPPVKGDSSRKEIDSHFLTPIGLYVLADKYEVARLLRRTLGLVQTAMSTHRGLLDDEIIKTVVDAYYSRCARPQSGMGIAIATGLAYKSSWVISGNVQELGLLVTNHGHFAADLIIAIRRAALFRK